MNYRNDRLLALAHDIPCQLQIPGVCVGGMGEAAHSNFSEHGKGVSMKAHDCFFSSACRPCHHAIDNGNLLTRDERRQYWRDGHDRTMLTLWRLGKIRVA